jgi:hypothetical protein
MGRSKGRAVQSRTRQIVTLIAVASVSAAAGGWLATAAFDSRMQVMAADMAQGLSRKLDLRGMRSEHKRRPDPGRQFRVERDRTPITG